MNHLCGLSNIDDVGDRALPNLTEMERRVLTTFRQQYESALCREYNKYNSSSSSSSSREEKKDSSSPIPIFPTLPTYEITEEQLTPSGLRPLDNLTLYRYLLADRRPDGTFDSNTSYKRLLGALQFRKKYECDTIVSSLSSPSPISPTIRKSRRLRVGIWAGVDRNHRPVVFERLGQFFKSGNVNKLSQEDWMMSYLYFLETHFYEMRKSAMRSGCRNVDRIVYFADADGIVKSITNRKIWKVLPLLKTLVTLIECHYPEIVEHIVLFNVPKVASAVYKVVKAFLDPVTAGKIELFSGVPYGRFKELLEEDVIPVEYGGTNRIDYPQTSSN